MANLNYSVGLPDFDWYNLTDVVLDNGTFGTLGGSNTSLTMTFGTTTLVLGGTGLSASGSRTLNSGTITSLTLIENGTTVVTANGFSPSVPASSFQSVLTAYEGSSVTVEQVVAQLFGSQAINITGSADRDEVFSGTGNDVINSNGGDDSISAGAGNDTVNAGAGEDFIRGGAGVDSINGGADYDTLGFYGYPDTPGTTGVTVRMNTAGVLGGGTVTGTLDEGTVSTTFVNIERVEGSERNDTFIVGAGFVGTADSDGAFFNGVGEIRAVTWVGAAGNDTFTDTSGTSGGLSQINYDAEKFTRDQQVWGDDAGEYGVIVNISGASISANIGYGATTVAAGRARDTYQNVDTIAGVVQFRLTDAQDYFVAGNNGSAVDGRAGNDTLIGGNGEDHLRGGIGNDTLTAGGGDDDLRGDIGNDTVNAGAGDDFIRGDAGIDSIDGGADYDTIGYYGFSNTSGTTGITVQMNTSGVIGGGTVGGTLDTGTVSTTFVDVERIEGTERNDTFLVGAGYVGSANSDGAFFNGVGEIRAATWVGAAGDDTFTDTSGSSGGLSQINYDAEKFTRDQQVWGDDAGEYGVIVNISGASISANIGYGATTVAAGTARDTYQDTDTISGVVQFRLTDTRDYFVAGNIGVYADGRGGNDTLIGGDSQDHLFGGDGTDSLSGRGGSNDLHGGTGNDFYYVDTAGDEIDETAGQGTLDRVLSSVSFALAADDDIEYLATNDETGTDLINLTGNALGQTLVGNAASNTLNGGAGIDTMRGLGGGDSYFVDVAGDIIQEAAGGGSDRIISSVSYTIAAGVEMESIQTNNQTATTAINFIGNEFAQSLVGNNGANNLNGMGGFDILRGLGGNDTYFVDTYADQIVEVAGQGTLDRVLMSTTFNLAADDDIEYMGTTNEAGTAAINMVGNALNQVLVGNAGINVLNGGTGADDMRGLGGNDFYYVDNALDTIQEGVGQGTLDRVLSSISFTLAADDNVEYLATTTEAGTGAINLTGNAIAQTIVGNAGVNVINGGAGNDMQRGLGGADFFVFNTALGANNVDTLSDFTSADTIRLENAIFTGLTGTGTLSSAQFVSNTTGVATTASQHIIYETDTGNLYYDSNGSAAGGSVLFAHLSTGLALTSADFVII